MKILKFILVILVACFSFSMNAEETARARFFSKPCSSRPSIPSEQYVEVWYENDTLWFSFSEDISYLIVEIEYDNRKTKEFVTQDTPSIYMPSFSGLLHLKCESDNGNIFEGELII